MGDDAGKGCGGVLCPQPAPSLEGMVSKCILLNTLEMLFCACVIIITGHHHEPVQPVTEHRTLQSDFSLLSLLFSSRLNTNSTLPQPTPYLVSNRQMLLIIGSATYGSWECEVCAGTGTCYKYAHMTSTGGLPPEVGPMGMEW